jgi:hypothetical protein
VVPRIAVAAAVALLVTLSGMVPALAQSGAPFCAGLNCAYFDITSCQKALGSETMCRINPNSAKAKDYKGGGAVCGMSTMGGNCFYFDLKACQQAVGPGGTCVGAPRK